MRNEKWSSIRPSFEVCRKCYEKSTLDAFRLSKDGLLCLQLWRPVECNEGYTVYDSSCRCLSVCFPDMGGVRQFIDDDGCYYIPGVGLVVPFEKFIVAARRSMLECYINEGCCPYLAEHMIMEYNCNSHGRHS